MQQINDFFSSISAIKFADIVFAICIIILFERKLTELFEHKEKYNKYFAEFCKEIRIRNRKNSE